MTEDTEIHKPKSNIFVDSDDEEGIQRSSRPKKPIFDDSSDEDEPASFSKNSDRLNGAKEDSENETAHRGDSSSDEEKSRRHSPAKISSQPTSLTSDRSGVDQSDGESSVKSQRSSPRPKSAGSATDSSQSSTGEESDGDVSIEAIKSKIINKHRASKSTKFLPEISGTAPEKLAKPKPKKEKAPSRKAKEAALAEIHSETQRMMRERKVSLPYHKPKQRTLEDFLNRRKFTPAVRLKTTSDELAKVWKHVEEREKNAELFYRSESDDDDPDGTDQTAEKPSMDEPNIAINSEEPQCDTPDVNCEIQKFQSLPMSQPNESEEFPRLQLSEVLANTEDACNMICDNSPPVSTTENPGTVSVASLPVESIDTSTIVIESVSHESEPLESSENTTQSTPDIINSSYSLSEKISSLNLPISKCPKITGEPDEVIDLDELSTKPGAFGLMQRFIKHSKLRPKKKTEESVLSIISSEVDANGEVIGVSGETIKLKKEEPKPGERLVVLKTTLQQKIAINREQQLAKRIEEYKLYEDEFYGVDSTMDGELEEELLSEGECDGKEEVLNGDDDVGEEEEEKNIDNPFLEEEAGESGEDAEERDEDDEAENDGEADSVRLCENDSNDSGSEDTDDGSNSVEDVADDTLSLPPIPSGLRSLTGTQDAESFNESQLVALCSGNFSSSAINLQKLETSSEAFQDVREDQAPVADTTRKAFENDSDDEEIVAEKKTLKKRKQLTFSDDEDDDIGDTIKVADNNGDSGEEEENGEADDDEVGNEIEKVGQEDEKDTENQDEDDEEVQLAKKLSKGFLENEAELSESDWGSDDEDEKGLDAYEEEEGDQEKISQRRLQKELGKIHAREVLAEDNREIRILQELLLEDGELHSDGPKRQRLYRWYNQDNDNPGERTALDFGENGGENEEEDEESWRRQRLERENFLRKKKIDNLDLEMVDSPVNFNDTRRGLKITPKNSPTVPKSPDIKSHFSIFGKRGSFLNRGEKMLSKLAEITNNAGTKEKSLGNSRNNRNMVFSVVSPPKETLSDEEQREIAAKRKGEPLASVMKKIKFSGNNNCSADRVSALAQLKLFEST